VRINGKEMLPYSVQDIAFELDSFTMGLKMSQFLKLKQPNAQASDIQSALKLAGIDTGSLNDKNDDIFDFTSSNSLIAAFKSETYKEGLMSLLHYEFEERLLLLRRADAINHNLEEANLGGEPKLGTLSTF